MSRQSNESSRSHLQRAGVWDCVTTSSRSKLVVLLPVVVELELVLELGSFGPKKLKGSKNWKFWNKHLI